MTGLLRTARVASLLNVSPDWVRAHAADLGAVRIGHPERGELRFDPDQLARYVQQRRLEQPDTPQRRKPGPKRGMAGAHFPMIELPKGAS